MNGKRTMAEMAAEVIDGYNAGLAGEPMGFVSGAFDLGWAFGAQKRAELPEPPPAASGNDPERSDLMTKEQ